MVYLLYIKFYIICIFSIFYSSKSLDSVWFMKITQEDASSYSVFPNYLFKDSYVFLQLNCISVSTDAKFRVKWILEELQCMKDMYSVRTQIDKQTITAKHSINRRRYQKSAMEYVWQCGDNRNIYLKDESNSDYYDYQSTSAKSILQIESDTHAMISRNDNNHTSPMHAVTRTWSNGMYHFLLSIEPYSEADKYIVEVYVEMRGHLGYLPAIKWPLLPYTGVMSLLYLVTGSIWLFFWACSLSHTKKIHVVIGAIAVAGALNHTLHFMELSYTAHTGTRLTILSWVCRLFGCMQDSLVHLLLMVVATGYGLTRPTLSRRMLTGAVLMATATFLTAFTLQSLSSDSLSMFRYTHEKLYAIIQDLYTCCILLVGLWITTFSVLTFHHMSTRKHSTKACQFSLFMVTSLISFAINLLIVIMLAYGSGYFTSCRQDWQYDWIYSSFGNILNFVLLVLLMLLWKPTNEEHSYSFQPLSQEGDAVHTSSDEEITEFEVCKLDA